MGPRQGSGSLVWSSVLPQLDSPSILGLGGRDLVLSGLRCCFTVPGLGCTIHLARMSPLWLVGTMSLSLAFPERCPQGHHYPKW